jgi:hypothetical protein
MRDSLAAFFFVLAYLFMRDGQRKVLERAVADAKKELGLK